MNVGSLYYVDSKVKEFTTICNAEPSDLENSVVTSRSWQMQESLERNGRFATGVNIDVGWLLKGGLDKDYVVKVNSSLTDVVLEEIPLGANWLIFAKLMEKPQCTQMAMRIQAGPRRAEQAGGPCDSDVQRYQGNRKACRRVTERPGGG
jgi:hypothetical protein